MSSESTTMEPPQGGSTWARCLQGIIDWLSTILNVAGTLLIFGLVILVNADVIGRTAFLSPISGVPEIVSMSIVAIVFLQVSQAFRMGRFTRTESFLDALQRRSPKARQSLELVYLGAALLLVWFLLAASYPLFQKDWERDTYVGTVGDFTFPAWPAKLIIVIGCVALILQILISIIRTAHGLFIRRSHAE